MGVPMKARFYRIAVVVCFLLVTAGFSLAQSDLATISGFVRDPSGAAVAGAKITITGPSGTLRTATTNESGYYVFTNVPPGLYTMSAESEGFQKFESRANKIDPAAHMAIDANLVVGATNQTVEVLASAVTLQTESASVQQLQELITSGADIAVYDSRSFEEYHNNLVNSARPQRIAPMRTRSGASA